MRELSEEHALLVTLAERMAERPVLVTFNGKSFDWPLLETRYRMTRTIRARPRRAPISIFCIPHEISGACALGSVRLAELEKHVLGWNRGADLISEMIPQFYFDYLRGGPPEPLAAGLSPQSNGPARLGRRSPAASSRCSPIRNRTLTTGWSSSASRASANDAAKRRARESIMRSRSPPNCPPKPTGPRAARSPASPSAKAISRWPAALGKHPRNFARKVSKLTNSWPSTMNMQPTTARAAPLVRNALAELQRARRHAALSAALLRRYKTQFEHRLKRLDRLERQQQKAAGPLLEP